LLDVIGFGKRFITFIRSRDKLPSRSFWTIITLGREQPRDISDPEGRGLVEDELIALEEIGPIYLHHGGEFGPPQMQDHQHDHQMRTLTTSLGGTLSAIPSQIPEISNDTLCEPVHRHHYRPNPPLFRHIREFAHAMTERVLVFAGFTQLVTGIVVYTGGCRGSYINLCLAHLISTFSHLGIVLLLMTLP
jgi:hypothetical protein